jgi:hypothetical protein
MPRFRRCLVIVLAGSAIAISLAAWAQPSRSVFAGKWSGSWGGVSDSTLDVVSVTHTGVAHGVYTFRDQSSKFYAQVNKDKLTWGDLLHGIGFEFTLLPDGKLHGERYDHGAQAGEITMTKV